MTKLQFEPSISVNNDTPLQYWSEKYGVMKK